jgi:predicted  nucleic acid-binding Zn-ribbon protein
MKTLEFNSSTWLFAQSDFINPFLTTVKFVFADDKPNANNQAIPYDEFASLAQSAIGMPIKIRFLGKGIGGHTGSIPVGHIRDMIEEAEEDGSHKLIAEGVLYNDEYPEVVEFLKESFDTGDAPGISWEISYKESIVDKGIHWLKGVVARAATFVKHPAYGTRTALLALASDKTLSDEDIENELVDMANDIVSHKQGGTNNVELEEALQKIKDLEAQIAEKDTALVEAKAETETVRTEATELKVEVDELLSKVNSFEKSMLIEARMKKVVEAGVSVPTDEEELTKKQEFWAAMSEEVFTEYVSDLAAVAKVAPEKKASASVLQLPKISVDTSTNNGAVSAESLRNKMRSLSRNEAE